MAARDAGGKTQASLNSPSRVLQIPCGSVSFSHVHPRGVPCWVPELGHGDSVFILFCLNELVCGRVSNRGLCILETSTWGMYPWRSKCQTTLCWLKKKPHNTGLCTFFLFFFVSCAPHLLQIPPCFVLCSLQTGFTVSKGRFSPSLAAAAEVQACLGSSGKAFIAT